MSEPTEADWLEARDSWRERYGREAEDPPWALRRYHEATYPVTMLALLDALDEAERERDELGKAAFAAILAAGEDTDGARSWADYFRPLKFPAWDVAVQRAVTRLREDLAQSDDEAEAAEAALARVRALHRVDQGTEGRAIVRCVCEERWPCSTVAALVSVTEEGDGENGDHE